MVARLAKVAAVVVAVSAVLSACGIGWEDLEISSVEVDQDGRTLVVGMHCHEDVSVSVEESRDSVRLLLRGYSYRGDCAATTSVVLADPLGSRAVIDESTGMTISVKELGE